MHGQGFGVESESQALIKVTYPIGYWLLGPTKVASVSNAENHIVGGRAALHTAFGSQLSGEPTCWWCTTHSISGWTINHLTYHCLGQCKFQIRCYLIGNASGASDPLDPMSIWCTSNQPKLIQYNSICRLYCSRKWLISNSWGAGDVLVSPGKVGHWPWDDPRWKHQGPNYTLRLWEDRMWGLGQRPKMSSNGEPLGAGLHCIYTILHEGYARLSMRLCMVQCYANDAIVELGLCGCIRKKPLGDIVLCSLCSIDSSRHKSPIYNQYSHSHGIYSTP